MQQNNFFYILKHNKLQEINLKNINVDIYILVVRPPPLSNAYLLILSHIISIYRYTRYWAAAKKSYFLNGQAIKKGGGAIKEK